jgi:ubiquinone/menaquinone biosynthesis C-methylase UbiE
MEMKRLLKMILPPVLLKIYEAMRKPGISRRRKASLLRHIEDKRIDYFDIEFKKKARSLSDEEFAAAYDKFFGPKAEGQDWVSDAEKFLLESIIGAYDIRSVCDVGFGSAGLFDLYFRKNIQVKGIDCAKTAVQKAIVKAEQRGYTQVDLRIGFAERIPFEDDSCDMAVCINTLEHVRDVSQAVNELIRIAKRYVLVIVPKETPSKYSFDYHINYFSGRKDLARFFPEASLPSVYFEFLNEFEIMNLFFLYALEKRGQDFTYLLPAQISWTPLRESVFPDFWGRVLPHEAALARIDALYRRL